MHLYHRSDRRAFTLVELLVVIAIIGVLVAMLLPAVQMAREAARRTHCKNNVKQIGLALHLYHDVHKVLPPGWLADVPDGEPGWGWAAFTLPFMEQNNLYEGQIDTTEHIDEPSNAVARNTVVDTFICPSDPYPNRFMLTSLHTPLFEIAKSNYVGVLGTLEIADYPSNGDGVFYHNSSTRFADITDGLSNTMIVGERCSRLGYSTWVGMVHGADDAMARIVGITDHTPNHPSAHFDDFSSQHTNGAHFLMGDGSVARIDDTIDFTVYQGLATRGGGEVVQIP